MEDKTITTMESNKDTNETQKSDDIDTLIVIENTIDKAEHTNPAMIDLENKMGIIYNVLKACIKEHNENVYYYMDYLVGRMIYLTNLPRHILYKIMCMTEDPKKTDVLEVSVLETPEIDCIIRQTLVKHYVTCETIPRTASLIHLTIDHCYNYKLDQQLKKSGYIWRRLPNTKRAIIVEHPKRVIQRQDYLQQIINYRKEKRHIVYIETKYLNRTDKIISNFQSFLNDNVNYIVVLVAVANDKVISGNIFVSKSIYKCQKLIENYIIKEIVPTLSEPSVLILEDKSFYRKSLPVPTIESEKCEMINWLKINGLLHEERIHRSELFDLIQRCKNKSDLHHFDATLLTHGHEILRRPSRTDYLNYYNPLWSCLSSTEDFAVFISKKNQDFWRSLEQKMVHAEISVINEDKIIENITDRIFTMANNINVNEWADTECDKNKDSLIQEESIIEIKNSFLPDELYVRERQFLSEINKFDRMQK